LSHKKIATKPIIRFNYLIDKYSKIQESKNRIFYLLEKDIVKLS